MKKLLLGLVCLFVIHSAIGQITKYNLLFEEGRATLTDFQKKELDSLAITMKDGKKVAIYPLVHDKVFDRLAYTENSRAQANSAKDYLEDIGFEILGTPSNFPSAYKGISIRVNAIYRDVEDEEAVVTISKLQSMYPEKPSQFYVIDPNRDTIIVGNEGTVLYIDSGSLMSDDLVKLELKEFYTLGDYMKNAMPTTSNGSMIETGGSIYLDARENGNEDKKVRVDPNQGIGVDFTLGKDDPSMQIFVKDPNSPNEMNWIVPKKAESSWVMTDTELDADGNIISQETFYSKEAWEKHLEEEKNERENEAKLAELTEGAKGVLRVYGLGFINCDKFIDEPMSELSLVADGSKEAEYFLVYHDIRGVMTGRIENGIVQFGSVPLNRKATLIALSYDDSQAYYFESEVIASADTQPHIQLKAVERSFIDTQLAMLK